MAYEGTQIGADGKRYKAGEGPSDEEAREATDQKVKAMQDERDAAKLNAASIGNREWGNATQNFSNADGPVVDETAGQDAEESDTGTEESDEDAEAAEREENLASVEDVEGDFPKHKGGGWYVTSDGNTVQGKEDAEKAEEALS